MKTITQDKKIPIKICYSTIIGFGLIIILIWMNEIFDIPHILFKAPAIPVNITESVIESIGVSILGIITTLYIYSIFKRLKYVSGFLHICAYCKKIKFEGTWITLEEFMLKYSEVKLSHGLCPECYKNLEKTL